MCPCHSCAGGNGWPCSVRSASRVTVIHPRLSFCSIRSRARSRIAARPMTSRARRTGSARTACRTGSPTGCRKGARGRMPKPLVKPGAVIDGYTIGECVHAGGIATLWTVTHADIDAPLLMKIPRASEGEDPAAIVSFEMEMMILPRLTGPHVPHCYGTGDFAHQAYAVIERISGTTLYKRLPDLPLPYDEV